jgi:PAS domain S-box-containing protein
MNHVADRFNYSINTSSFFESVFRNSSTTSILVMDTEGYILASNEAFRLAYGYKQGEVEGTHFSRLYTKDDQINGRPADEIRNAKLKGSISEHNFLVNRSGFSIWTRSETILAGDGAGKQFLIKYISDINHLKLLQESLQEKEFSDKILESINEPIVAIDSELKILKANKAFYDIFKNTVTEHEPRTNFITPVGKMQGEIRLKEILRKILPQNFTINEPETEYYFPRSGRKIMNLNFFQLNSDEEKEKRIIIVFKDVTKIRKTEQSLKKQLIQTQQILESLPIIAFTTDLEGRTTYLNKSWEIYTGDNTDLSVQQPDWSKYIHPEDFKTIESFYTEREKGFPFEKEIRMLRNSDQMYRWHLIQMKPVKKENNATGFWVGTSTDIHNEKTKTAGIEQILLESQELGKIATYEINLLTQEINCSPNMNKIFGIPAEQPITIKEIRSRLEQKDRDKADEIFKQAKEQLKGYSLEYVITHPDGKRISAMSRGKVYGDENNRAVRIVGTIIDITENKIKEEEINKLQTILLESQELSHTGSYEFDFTTKKLIFSPELYRIFGIEPGSEIPLDLCLSYINAEDRQKVKTRLESMSTEENTIESEFRITAGDGIEKILISKSRSICENGNKPTRLYGSVHDITNRKKVEEELIKANTELENRVQERNLALIESIEELKKVNHDLDTFVYTASHDLKAPINNIDALVQHLQEELSRDSREKEIVKEILKLINISIEKFRQNIADLSVTAKAKSGTKENNKANCDNIFRQVQSDLEDCILKFNAKLQSDFSKAPEIKMANKNLRSIMFNLISNAVKYSDPERKPLITLETMEENDFIILKVSDNGLGIPETDRDKVFSMYHRLHDHVEGTGVGMAIVKRIVDNNGGKIEIESEIGKGTTFNVYLKK